MLTPATFKIIRTIKGLTQSDLADQSGVSLTTISHFESGRKQIRSDTVIKICKSMGVDISYTVNGRVVTGP